MSARVKEKSSEKKRVSRRYLTMFLFVMFWGILIIAKMAIVMFGERTYWNDVKENLVPANRVIDPRRGNILSDEGLLLASSMKQYRVFLDFATYEKNEKRAQSDQYRKDTLFDRHIDEFCQQMHGLFPQYSVSQLKQHYTSGKASKTRHSWPLLPGVSRNSYPISYNQYKTLVGFVWLRPRNEGWFYSAESKISRQKPFGALASRTLGDMYAGKDSARYGLELSFDSLLRGTPGVGHIEKVQNVSHLVADIPQIDGCDIVTTINVDMQDFTEVALRKELEQVNAVSGIAVIMEVKTGDIKAIASMSKTDNGYQEIQNNAVKDIFEPGSTFKPVSMMVALDDGKISLTDSVFCEWGRYTGFGGGAVMTDAGNGYGWLDVPGIIKKSCNIGTSKLITAAYRNDPESFVDGIYRTGINTHFDLQLIGTGAPVIRRDGYWDATRLPWMSIGYNTQLPVINTLAFYNGIANGGKMVAPRLVTEVRHEGEIVQSFPVSVVREQMCKPKTLEEIKFLLEGVVDVGGSGHRAASKHFKVAGKTGTAQLSQGAAGYKNGTRTHMVSFCGYFPADDPQYTCIVSIRTSGGAAGGGTMAAPVFHEISEKVMASRNLRSVAEAADTIHEFMPRVLSGDMNSTRTVLRGLGMNAEWKDKDSIVWGSYALDSAAYRMTRIVEQENMVPNVIGMGAQDALYILENAGLRVELQGVGRVRSQSLPGRAPFRKGDRIYLSLSM
ncbi:MAG: transpeptidase family protein [Bacteroidaceae bacterium]|nr:transpeptidase family protein [Bacteroidaceae bacterium]